MRQGENISFLLQCNNYHKFSGLKQHSFRGSGMAAAAAAAAKSLQSCLTLCDPVDGNPPDYSVPGILQARVLESGAIAFSSQVGSNRLIRLSA